MKKVFWTFVAAIMAYALPILVAYALTGEATVFFGFILLVLSLVIFAIGSNDFGWMFDRLFLSSIVTLVLGVIMTLAVVIHPNSGIIFLTIAQFFVGLFVCLIEYTFKR